MQTDEYTSSSFAGPGWSIAFADGAMSINSAGGQRLVRASGARSVNLRRSLWRWRLHVGDELVASLRGLRRRQARSVARAIVRLELDHAVAWATEVDATLAHGRHVGRWIASETIDDLRSRTPELGLRGRMGKARIEPTSDAERRAPELCDTDLVAAFRDTNDRILESELVTRASFFETIEKSPLTREQATAVACFDNRVHVLAAAGSGKTSVMVARAAYAVERGFVSPDRVLLLAFNKAAAAELQERIDARFKAAGIDSTGVRAATFHSFGLSLIGAATGKKPRLADWAEPGRDVKTIRAIVDELRDSSPRFRYRWDLFRTLFARTPIELHGSDDGSIPLSSFQTFDGTIVKSEGERLIANWLFLNGITYEYERLYCVDVADASHSQYRPDFYYPDIDAWHEHWAIGRDGEPPKSFDGYADSMEWKRELHRQAGTALIETTWADVMFGTGLEHLERELVSRGAELDWNPDRPISGEPPLKHEDLVGLMRTFMAHVKSSSLHRDAVQVRLAANVRLAGFRTELFLELFWPILDEWNRRLRADNLVDFDDMLVLAADHLEAGTAPSDYDLVMVDEFQDSSQTRARVIRGLLHQPNKFLLAVGDDWQAINRFAGADISVMTDFEEWFGAGQTLRLSTTFRCPQSICDTSRQFVAKNPRQFDKEVKSASDPIGSPVRLIRTHSVDTAVADYLAELGESVAAECQEDTSSPERRSVLVLGRYRFQSDLVPPSAPSNLDVTFRTVHGSKGLEADYVLVPVMSSGNWGFPSRIADDPVLDLVMATPDKFPHAEERRLFYVALTRARRAVTLIAEAGAESTFVLELLQDGRLDDTTAPNTPPVEVCRGCGQGTMKRRKGKFGAFLGCSRFPACRTTRSLKS